jgi:hypothetical protein
MPTLRLLPLLFVACSPAEPPDVYAYANGCSTVHAGRAGLVAADAAFRFAPGDPTPLHLAPADLGTYLLYDPDGGYLVAEADGGLQRQTRLESDVTRQDDSYVSGAEWQLEASGRRTAPLQLRNRRTGRLLGVDGLADADQGAALTLAPAEGCVAPPELSLDAEGTVARTTFPDGDLYGIADTHAHLMSNWGFGGGGIFHGAPFHRLGVEHALPDCAVSHGVSGRQDFIGYSFDAAGASGLSIDALLPSLLAGELPEDNHVTAGYPDFTDWPNAPTRSTHQTEYYRWLERAWLAGLRLVVQHATTNAVLCQLSAGSGDLPLRYPCDDMVAVDRSIAETYALQRYLDARAGGPGRGWFRVVSSPAEAREVIAAGKLAVILGIEASDLFGCRLVPRAEDPVCDEAYVVQQLDAYVAQGVRALFPVHKYDNAFSPGDGDRAFIEVGNFLNSGHYSNFVTEDCPAIPTVFDDGDVVFGGLNQPREDYLAPPPNDLSGFADDPIDVALPYVGALLEPPLTGDYCQNAGLTSLGGFLLDEMMQRGMIVEIDHLPRRSYQEAFARLAANDYPAAGTHGNSYDGQVFDHGGISKFHVRQCRDPKTPGAMLASLAANLAERAARGAYPAEGFGLDLNGFAGAHGPRFADGACPTPQEEPVTYPFSSYAGDVTFTEPFIGNRRLDFNTEGLVHVGLLPELLQDARADAASDADLEPLFRSAEGYLRMWEAAEARGAALRSAR